MQIEFTFETTLMVSSPARLRRIHLIEESLVELNLPSASAQAQNL